MSETEHGVLYSVDVRISAPVQPTEITDRVVEAVTGLFPSADVETEANSVADGDEATGGASGEERPASRVVDDTETTSGASGTAASRVVAEAHDVEPFREQLFEQRILDTARKEFQRNRTASGFSFDLKKQAAFVGQVNFSVGSPDELGDIHVDVTVTEPDVDSFISYLAPETEDGEPVEHLE